MRNATQEAAPPRKRGFSIIKPLNNDVEVETPSYEEESDRFKSLFDFLSALGIKFDLLSRDEAARIILERPIRIVYRPTIVEIDEPSRTYE